MSAPGDLLAQRYRLERRVGAGGMGVVWEAFDVRLHRRVAVKQLHAQPWLSDAEAEVVTNRALREARITARLNHPHAVPVYDVVEEDGHPCLVMQFFPSEPLSSVLSRRGALTEPEVAQLGAQTAGALEAAHRVGIVHRDVKPGNVLVASDGTVRLSDFGIAHALGDVSVTATGLVAGTPEYLAPEVARGHEPGYPADVFSLGATLYAALEGRPPFGTDTNRIALLHRVAAGVIDVPERTSPLTSLLVQMLAADPSARPSMHEVAVRLADLADAHHASAPAAVGAGVVADSTTPSAATPVSRAADPPPTQLHPSPQPYAATAGAPPRTRRRAAGESAAAPPAPPPPPATTRRARASSGDRRRPSRTRRRLAAALAIAVALLVPLLFVVQGIQDGGQVSAGAPQASPSPNVEASAPAAPTPSPSTAAPSLAPAPSAPAPSAPAPSAPAPSAPVAPAPGSALTSADSVRAITSYYALLPASTDRAWPLMTTSYQSGKAGGRQSYQRFWDAFTRVTATEVSAVGPSTVEATISYYGKDGRVVRERTSFGLVNDAGVVKINSSQVLRTF